MCFFHYHMKQRIYLAEIRGERYEAMRLERELEKHQDACLLCGGVEIETLASNLFGRAVYVRNNDNQN